jgi:hypothetical protein
MKKLITNVLKASPVPAQIAPICTDWRKGGVPGQDTAVTMVSEEPP